MLDLRSRSSTVFWNLIHQEEEASPLQYVQPLHLVEQEVRGGSGNVQVGSLYSGILEASDSFCDTSPLDPVRSSPTHRLSKYSTIFHWKSEFGSIILSRISCGVRQPVIHSNK
jgi:hypothetical protein